MSSKRLAMIAALFLIASMILTACGGDTATNTPVVAPTDTTAAVAPTDTAAPAATDTTAPVATDTVAPAATNTIAAAADTPTVAASVMVTAAASTTDKLYSAADCAYGGIIKSIEAVDASTVKFTLCKPDPSFPSKAAFATTEIHEEAYLQKTGGTGPDLLQKPIGSGPYMVQEWVQGDHITFVPNPNYWGEAPQIKTLILKWNKDATARLTSLKAGEADGIDNVDPTDIESVKADSTLRLVPRDPLNTLYLGMNNTMKPFDDEKVRQAVAMAIDKQTIISKFYPAGSLVADYFTPCSILGGCEGDPWYKYDPAAAKAAIDAISPGGLNVTLSYRSVVRGYLPAPDKAAEEIQAQLKAADINATLDVQESGTLLTNASEGKFQIFLLGWGADYPDQTDFVDYHFGVGASDSFGTKFKDLTDAISAAGQIADPAARKPLYATVNNLIKQHVPMVPIAHGANALVYSANVPNGFSSPIGNETFANMSVTGKDTMVFIQNAEPESFYCNDETDGEAIRACIQVFDSLLAYKPGGVDVVPGLAESFDATPDATSFTFHLRKNAKFSDGNPVTAADVVTSYAVQWDAANPLHKGNSGNFDYWGGLFGAFLNK